ncbi:poly(U)-specific endoribonuclease-C-like [Amphibalanus amphitrite]|uniref:poly(U)-specific endoribonuclease-C-like n=1 Tax=Amphibalanus amphitrite TaxID=1232801 RepID=UPI001C8FB8E6|nr:poly(U)-specific endoribonuclease-C-like [Amphibalanus amphitrite]XP_043208444.1 poly(U)-specific endoribonuclease-C-like [Amphibalanus amphitrite]XP_043208446.1 poly(U)-specific endoribonuclease-C-like [Amphibalanus amphitrite]XP_043208447.1 poly(U)-specific endoribonuclease-C-like [Amphibalanus amphitrite]XP_043208448.1 poly(U)-specific endoribonuclease-C-like [Amphibalanus amphitrite]XP_043208449.1 poly(U)-specific endoribonuclease-C-like [Amphibalanus amphitrite]XP_043208450.1 poly(U)-
MRVATVALVCLTAAAVCTGSRSPISDREILELSAQLFDSDTNNVYDHLDVNTGGRVPYGKSTDYAQAPLLEPFNATRYLSAPTYTALVNFYNNYERDVNTNERHTPEEHNEQVHFINKITETPAINKVKQFLSRKGYVPSSVNSFKRTMKALWFDFYGRRRGKLTSSGFEHVLLGEVKNRQVSGFHNWVYFYFLERKNQVNYLGYKKYKLIRGRNTAMVIKFPFKWDSYLKPVTSMLVGTSPEVEISLFTLCFYARPDRNCRVKLGNQQLVLKTHTYRSGGRSMIGSAYVDL